MNNKLLRFVLFGSILVTLVSWWDHEYVVFLKHFVVLVHEISHAVAALLSGGIVEKISIHANEAGETSIFSGNVANTYPFIISAGYIGPTIMGTVLMNRGFLGNNQKSLLVSFGLFILVITLLYTETGSLAFQTGLVSGGVMVPVGFISSKLSRTVLVFLGAAMSLYSVYDLFDFTKNVNHTDAGILAGWILGKGINSSEITPLGYLIALFWSMINLAIIYVAVIKTFHIDQKEEIYNVVPDDSFPGEMTPEVAEWFYKRGLDIDGRPLLPETESEMDNHKGMMNG